MSTARLTMVIDFSLFSRVRSLCHNTVFILEQSKYRLTVRSKQWPCNTPSENSRTGKTVLKLVKIQSLRKISLISRTLWIFQIRNFTRKCMLVGNAWFFDFEECSEEVLHGHYLRRNIFRDEYDNITAWPTRNKSHKQKHLCFY
jgi:hypothetical protein